MFDTSTKIPSHSVFIEPSAIRILTRFGLIAVAFCSFITGCGPNQTAIVTEHQPTASQQIERFREVLTLCRAKEAVLEGRLPTEFPDVVFVSRLHRPEGNARTVWLDAEDQLSEKVLDDIHPSYGERDHWWSVSSKALSANPELSDRELANLSHNLTDLNATEYVLVIKTREFRAPKHVEGVLFELGGLRGEAHLYRLADAEHLGAIIFSASGQSLGPIDLTLDASKPEASVRTLTDRLYGNIHDFAQAHWADKVKGADSVYTVESGGAFFYDELVLRSP